MGERIHVPHSLKITGAEPIKSIVVAGKDTGVEEQRIGDINRVTARRNAPVTVRHPGEVMAQTTQFDGADFPGRVWPCLHNRLLQKRADIDQRRAGSRQAPQLPQPDQRGIEQPPQHPIVSQRRP
ncbi:hypothetical protein [Azospirillum sp.]|uniref:hypothetical protein n=1 Tax=Azospirillum sp. TaxID=34012 RepID=UPI0026275F3D|nr:hypothetical protein [Azospirillum sp.]